MVWKDQKLKRSLGKGVLVRPSSGSIKKEILDYLKKHNIDYIKDDSNLRSDFDRNYLRNKIFPILEKKWNNFPNRVSNFSKIIKDRNDNYSDLMHEKYNDLISNSINLKKLRELSDPLIADVLRYSIKKCNLAVPNSKIIQEIIKTLYTQVRDQNQRLNGLDLIKRSEWPNNIHKWSYINF